MNSTDSENSSEIVLDHWIPEENLEDLDPNFVRMSCGFLRCRPEKWFPNLAAQWLPLAHALGVEIRVIDIQPLVAIPSRRLSFASFKATIDGESAAIVIDDQAQSAIREAFTPGVVPQAGQVVLDYLARRLFGSLGLSWSGPESSTILYDNTIEFSAIENSGVVEVSLLLNGQACGFFIVLGPKAVNRLDGLWRRQLRSTRSANGERTEVNLEIAQLAVLPNDLSNYTRTGTMVDLEVTASENCYVLMNNRPWLTGKLRRSAEQFVVEVVGPSPAIPTLPPSTVKLGIRLGSFNVDGAMIAEFSQVGSCIQSPLEIGNRVHLVSGGGQSSEILAEALLCVYQGRFAITVL